MTRMFFSTQTDDETWPFHLFRVSISLFLGSIPYISSTQAPETEAILSTHQCHDICPYQSIASLNKRLHKWQPARSVSYILQSTKTGCYSCHELDFSLCDIAVTALTMQNNEFINTKASMDLACPRHNLHQDHHHLCHQKSRSLGQGLLESKSTFTGSLGNN